MKLVVTVLARDEADIIDAQVAFHLNAGADFVIATDNNSQDGTNEILRRYERQGVLHLIHEPAEGLHQSEWVTRMARLAATELGADWVINTDADEFWWPRGESLKNVLAAIVNGVAAVIFIAVADVAWAPAPVLSNDCWAPAFMRMPSM